MHFLSTTSVVFVNQMSYSDSNYAAVVSQTQLEPANCNQMLVCYCDRRGIQLQLACKRKMEMKSAKLHSRLFSD